MTQKSYYSTIEKTIWVLTNFWRLNEHWAWVVTCAKDRIYLNGFFILEFYKFSANRVIVLIS